MCRIDDSRCFQKRRGESIGQWYWLLRDQYASLGIREREVMGLVVSGLLNKHIGAELGISEITVKAHRGKMMRKMRADSLADLVNMAARLRVAPPKEYPDRSFSS